MTGYAKLLVYAVVSIMLICVGAVAGWAYAGKTHAEAVAVLQDELAEKSFALSKQEQETAEQIRRASVIEQDRIQAIKVSDGQTKRIEMLQLALRSRVAKQSTKNNTADDLVIFRGSFIERVWDEAVRGGEQARSIHPLSVQSSLFGLVTNTRDIGTPYSIRGGSRCFAKTCCWRVQKVSDKQQRASIKL